MQFDITCDMIPGVLDMHYDYINNLLACANMLMVREASAVICESCDLPV